VRVLVVDDHPMTRDGIVSVLADADGIEVVGEATDGEEAVEQADKLKPDVIFMDVRMPKMGGLEATRTIRKTLPDVKVILFTVEEGRSNIAEAIQAGVSGYLLKDVSADEIVKAARLAMEGKAVIHPALTQTFIEEAQSSGGRRHEELLSPRETEILQMIAYGSTTKEVASKLKISPHTVKTHLERIFEKLRANDRAEAVAIALRRGLVD
jgi:DNA-binding NarL/FixJ family response regulator